MVETKGCNDDLWFLSGDIPSVQNLEGACLLFQPVMSNSSLFPVILLKVIMSVSLPV